MSIPLNAGCNNDNFGRKFSLIGTCGSPCGLIASTGSSCEPGSTSLGTIAFIYARIEYLEKQILFRNILSNIRKYFSEIETKVAQRKLSDIGKY